MTRHDDDTRPYSIYDLPLFRSAAPAGVTFAAPVDATPPAPDPDEDDTVPRRRADTPECQDDD